MKYVEINNVSSPSTENISNTTEKAMTTIKA